MLDVPSRESLAALADSANAIRATAAVGFVRALDDGRASILYSHPHGIGAYTVPAAELSGALVPGGDDVHFGDADSIRSQPERAIEWHLLLANTRGIVSAPVPHDQRLVRFWAALLDEGTPTPDESRAFERVAVDSARVLSESMSTAQSVEQLRRLELAAGLLPAIRDVLDVREVFERLSVTSQSALPHDMLTLGLFGDDLRTMTVYAKTGRHSDLGTVFPQPYPVAVTQAWEFDVIDDRAAYPLERDRPASVQGMRSSLRVALRTQGRILGGLAFHSSHPGRYASLDVAVGRRLADHVAVALVHHRLAEESRRAAAIQEELRARTTSLELLDELLSALTGSGNLRDVFERISGIAGRVLRHDATALLVSLPDGVHARVYASAGFPSPMPEIQDIPADVLEKPEWEHEILEDISLSAEPRFRQLLDMGFRCILRVPIRFDQALVGTLHFVARMPSAFRPPDVLIARRVADRLAVALARDRELQASRRADEAALRASQLEARVRALTEELDARTGYRRVVGDSREWRQVLTQATQVAATDTTVLLLGDSGTGKEVVARFLHRGSARNQGPFVALNCAALPEQLLEAELFGYERGAYTGATQSKPGQLEQAAGGTLFLDEVAEMSPAAQAKFLRVLQEREFQRLGGTRVLRTDARVVAATNRDLHRAIANGHFREDLYYRLNVFAIRLPRLRDRREDILALSEAFLAEIGRGLGRPPAGISRDARQLLVDYHWPGNVRELRNILERAAILCDGGLITAEHLAITTAPAPVAPVVESRSPAGHVPADRHAPPASARDLEDMERTMILQALQNARFNKSKAAAVLGLTRRQLYVRMRKYNVD